MTNTTQDAARQAGKLATGADIKTAKAGAKLRFGGGLYLLVSGTGTKSWQVHYHVAGKHQAIIIGRWPDFGIVEAKAKREAIRQTIRAGGDPAQDRHEARAARQEADAATVRAVCEAWMERTHEARGWSAHYVTQIGLLMRKHVLPVIGDRPIGRVTVHEIEALLTDMSRRVRAQAVHASIHLRGMFDFAMRRDLVTVNPVRKIAQDLPRRVAGDPREVSYARVTTIADARTVLRAFEGSESGPFALLAHRLIALTAVRKMEAIGAQWSELVEGPDGMTWTIPAARMKGKRGHKREHAVPLSEAAADVFRAARALQEAMGIVSPLAFPGRNGAQFATTMPQTMKQALKRVGMPGLHTVHGWRGTFSTICNEADPGAGRVIDVMLAHKTFGEVEGRYNKASFIAQRRALATTWADQLLEGAPTAFWLVGLADPIDNVVQLREAA